MTCSVKREQELASQGWAKQSVLDEPRLSEMAQEYRDLGFEVLLEPLDPHGCQNSDGCTVCFQDPSVAAQFKVIFTRRLPGVIVDDDLA